MVSVVIGRFQTPRLTHGHLLLLNTASKTGQLIILVGVPRFQTTQRNPLDFRTRQQMLQTAFPSAIILPIVDQYSDEAWSEYVDSLLYNLYPHEEIKLFASRDSFSSHYKGRYKIETIKELEGISATELRKQVTIKDSEDFRAGVIYATKNQYPLIHPTVDVCIWRRFGKQKKILLGQKFSGKNAYWVVIGGHFDKEDPSYEFTALRETYEECELDLKQQDLKYVGSMQLDDWRCDATTKISTVLFAAESKSGEAKAGDDIKEVKWFSLEQAFKEISPQHYPLLIMASDFLKGIK